MPLFHRLLCARRMRGVFAALALLTLFGTASADDSLKIKVRIQPRLNLGDVASATTGRDETQLDLLIRRSRLELMGRPTDDILYILAVAGDRLGQRGSPDSGSLAYAFVDYRLHTSLSLRAGLVKLPFVRGAWVTSSRLLLIDRTQSASTAAGAFGDYITPHLTIHGRLGNGGIGYNLALMDGLEPGDTDRLSRASVTDSDEPGLVFRVDVSPPGWEEGRESEAHLGKGRHLTLAVNGGVQRGVHFGAIEEDRRVIGGDLSFHRGGWSFQAEYLRVDREGDVNISPAGWYAQAGYYLAAANLEPAVRLERFDADRPGGRDVTTTLSGGFNLYRRGHDLKIAANVVHTRFQRGVRPTGAGASRSMLQVQSQLYL